MKFTKVTALAGILLAAMAMTTACSGKKDNGNPAAASDVSTDPQERVRQFAKCMRDEGIDMPDPEFTEDGGMSISVGAAEAGDPNDPNAKVNAQQEMEKFEAAQEKCKKYMPDGGPGSGKADPEMEAKMREFAKCMRENGVENFPDPQEGGGIMIQGGGPGSDDGLNPDDPTFKAAQEKCQSILPAGKGGPATTTKVG